MSAAVVDLDWRSLAQRREYLEEQLGSSVLEPRDRGSLQREYSVLNAVLNKKAELDAAQAQAASVKAERDKMADPELKELYDQELSELTQRQEQLIGELEETLFPVDPIDENNVFIEIRAGTGGQEAALFAADLARMYTTYALKKGWKASIVDMSQTDLKGFREVTLSIEGQGAYGALKHESGVHRVQRVPQTESQGRIHTSTATVAVFPDVEVEQEIAINPSDLRIDTYRAGGAGGQHVNMTDSAVRITHLPTGVVAACQDERSQHKNKAKAMKMLASRLVAAQREKQNAEMASKRKEQVGTGERAEKVRTYNYPQNRVTDHQVEVTLKKLDMVMEGDLDEIIDALKDKDRKDRRAQGPLSGVYQENKK